MKPKIILTCEHANFLSPLFLKNDLQISNQILKSHRGWDQGALEVSLHLKKILKADLFTFPYSRLYVDANRTPDFKALSPLSRELDGDKKNQLIKISQNYRKTVLKKVESIIKKKQNLLVFSIHSFVPIFKSKKRKTDLGLLFRNSNPKEVSLATSLKKKFHNNNLNWAVHFNLPYRGHTDCFLNDILDQHLKNPRVNGLFIEINQKHLQTKNQIYKSSELISNTIKEILSQ